MRSGKNSRLDFAIRVRQLVWSQIKGQLVEFAGEFKRHFTIVVIQPTASEAADEASEAVARKI